MLGVSPEWSCMQMYTALCSAEWRRLSEQLRWLRNTTLGPESGMLTESDSPRFCKSIPASAGSGSYGFTVEERSLCQREFKSISSSGIRTARDLKLLRQYFKSYSLYVGFRAWLEHEGIILSLRCTARCNHHLKAMKWLYSLSLPHFPFECFPLNPETFSSSPADLSNSHDLSTNLRNTSKVAKKEKIF